MESSPENYPSLSQFSGFNAPDYDPDSMETDDLPKRTTSHYMQVGNKQIPKDSGIIIVDTNFFIDHRGFFNDLVKLGLEYNLLLVIPFTVLQELDGLKFARHLSPKERRELLQSIQNLHRYIAEGHPVVRGQRRDQILQDEVVKDDQILDCCLFFRSQFPDSQLTLLSRDRLLTTKCLVHRIYHVDVTDMDPKEYLIHLAIKAAGCEPGFVASESFKAKNGKIKPFSTSYLKKSKNSSKETTETYYGEPKMFTQVEEPSLSTKLDHPKNKDPSLSSSVHNTKLTARYLPYANYKAGHMGTPHENPNKTISPRQRKLHSFITEVVNYAEKELSILILRILQEEKADSHFIKSFLPPPWTLVQMVDLVNANKTLSKAFTATEISEFDGLLALTRAYGRLHQFGIEMFIPDIQGLLIHIFVLFRLSEKYGKEDEIARHHTIAQFWIRTFGALKEASA